MNLLNLPLDHLLANVVGLVICLGLIFTCICRLDLDEAMPWRVTVTQILLICIAFWSAGTMRDLWRGQDIGYHNAAAGLAFLLYLALTYEDVVRAESECEAREAARRELRSWEHEEDHHAGQAG